MKSQIPTIVEALSELISSAMPYLGITGLKGISFEVEQSGHDGISVTATDEKTGEEQAYEIIIGGRAGSSSYRW